MSLARTISRVFMVALAGMLLVAPSIAADLSPDDVFCLRQGGYSGTCFQDPSACPAGSNTPATSTVSIDDQAAQKAAQNAGNANVGYALFDSKGTQVASYNDSFENYSASITKSMILVAYLKQLGR